MARLRYIIEMVSFSCLYRGLAYVATFLTLTVIVLYLLGFMFMILSHCQLNIQNLSLHKGHMFRFLRVANRNVVSGKHKAENWEILKKLSSFPT